MSDPALILAALALAPVLVWICVADARDLRIPNAAVLSVFGIFLATGSWGLPIEVFLWRIGYGVAVLLGGFAIYQWASSVVGAGDLKLLAALAPFLSGDTVGLFCAAYVIYSLLGMLVLKGLRARAGAAAGRYRALDRSALFPAGIVISLSLATVLALTLMSRLA